VAVDALTEKFPDSFKNLRQKLTSATFTSWMSSTHPEEELLTDFWENDESISKEMRAMHQVG
jgi:hypothetical protein